MESPAAGVESVRLAAGRVVLGLRVCIAERLDVVAPAGSGAVAVDALATGRGGDAFSSATIGLSFNETDCSSTLLGKSFAMHCVSESSAPATGSILLDCVSDLEV